MASVSIEQIDEHIPALQRFAGSLTKNSHDAEDLVQDCVERALSRKHLFEPGTNLRAWLFTICRRIFLNGCRKRAVRGPQLAYDDVEPSIQVQPTQDVSMELRDVSKAFQTLPSRDKAVLSLITIDGLRYDEAAARLDIPVGTIRSRLSRARSRLAGMLDRTPSETAATTL